MGRTTHLRMLPVLLAVTVALIVGATGQEACAQNGFEARIFFEFNSAGPGDLGVHVFLDGEAWKNLKIVNPQGKVIAEVEGKRSIKQTGLTELFFEGEEPSLEDVPVDEFLARFPAGPYQFVFRTLEGDKIEVTATLSHVVPAAPLVAAQLSGTSLVINWTAVPGTPPDFPDQPDPQVVAYQVIVDSFQVTLPATATSVTVPPEFVASLESGEHPFEVLAIEAGGNQTITEGSFTKP